jgi:hypothetical protein
MSYLLLEHPKKYNFYESDASFLHCTFFPGMPFAKRHLEMAHTDSKNKLGHYTLALLNALPVIGLAMCWSEKIFGGVYEAFLKRKKVIHLKSTQDLPKTALVSQVSTLIVQVKPQRQDVDPLVPLTEIYRVDTLGNLQEKKTYSYGILKQHTLWQQGKLVRSVAYFDWKTREC